MPIRTEPWPAGTPCWLDIGVPDRGAAQEFYGAVMGWDFDDKGPEYGNYVIASRNGAAAAGIGPQQSPGQPVAWLLYLASDDARATATSVAANGGQVLMEPMEMPGSATCSSRWTRRERRSVSGRPRATSARGSTTSRAAWCGSS